MPDARAGTALYSARPRIDVDGRDQPGLARTLESLLVEETTDGLYRCEATFGNWGPRAGAVGFLHFDRELLDFGSALRLEMGAGTGAGRVFEGRVTGLEGRFPRGRPPQLLLLAEDRLQELRMTRRTRTFEETSDADLFRQLAGAHGLRAEVRVEGPTHRVLAQVNQSDLAFARERARAAGAELWVEDDALHVEPRARRDAGELTLTYGQGLHEFAALADLAHQASGFSVAGWDVAGKAAIRHRATESSISTELNGGLGGSRALEAALGARDQQVVHLAPFTATEAQALAEAHYARDARRFVTGRGVAEGDARLRVGARLRVEGVGPLFEGVHYVTEVRHTFDARDGYRTAFAVERAWIGSAA